MKSKISNALFLVVLTIVFLYVFAESNYIQNKNMLFIKASLFELILASSALVLVLWSWPSRSHNKWFKSGLLCLKSLLIFTVLLLVFIEAAVVDFSGMLFGPEAIVHFSWDAFVLGVQEYFWPFFAMLLFLLLSVFVMIYSSHALLTHRGQMVLFGIALLGLLFSFSHTVVGRYADGIQQYVNLNQLQSANENEIKKLEPFGITTLAVNKPGMVVSGGNQKNLIVVYLESFSDVFTTAEKYPDLTPNINRLKDQYESPSPYISTAKFTMDGLIGSLCGFLPNMTLGNNALTGSEKYYYMIPCMTDVLHEAGYHQEFYGGAKKSFAGKGTFLLDHGFDQVWGWEDFQQQAAFQADENHSWWGLHDDDLFSLAGDKITALHQSSTPFHISLLTLSTHLKGFPAPSCQPYAPDADKFIDAIHCTDQLLGRFIDRLEASNILDDTLVYITGDHSVFTTSLTEDLFGQSVNNKDILGVIIDKNAQQKAMPMGLYDMAPVLLDRLEIKHNVTFINGLSKSEADRLLFTRKQLYKNGAAVALDRQCQANEVISLANINHCTHKKIINTIHGYTQLFKLNQGLVYNHGSELTVSYAEKQSAIIDISLNGVSIADQFSRDGFKLTASNFKSGDAFFIQIDTQNKVISKTFLLNVAKDPLGIISYLAIESDAPFVVFGNQHSETLAFMQSLNQFKKLTCETENFCAYKLDLLGTIETRSNQTDVTLNFNQ